MLCQFFPNKFKLYALQLNISKFNWHFMMAIVYNRKPLKPNGLDGSVIKWLDGSKPDCFNCKKNWPIVRALERWRSSIAVSIFIGKSVIIERWCGGTRKNYFNRIELQANKMSPSDTNHWYVLMCALHPRRFASPFFGFSSSLLSVYFVNINPPTTSLLLFFKSGQWRLFFNPGNEEIHECRLADEGVPCVCRAHHHRPSDSTNRAQKIVCR